MKTPDYLLTATVFLLTSTAFAEEAPTFQDSTLSIPRIDTVTKVGQFQNAQFKQAKDGRWDLLSVTETKLATIEADSVLVTNTKPAQAFVKASGYFPSGCYGLGSINVRKKDNLFEVAIHQVELQTFAVCTQALVPFNVTVPLDIYGSASGTYQVSVNNGGKRSFTLTSDNYLQE